MSDENTQTSPEPTQPEPVSTPPVENPISAPNPIPVSPQEPMPDAPTPPTDSVPAEAPSGPAEAAPDPEEAIPVNNDISANEPFPVKDETSSSHGASEPAPAPEPQLEQNPAPETPKNPPETAPQQPTAQMAGNEPLDLTEEIKTKQRQENLKLANETRQEKKREKINEILNLFAEGQTVTNDEVEKLLHVSDATATRYLETLEKEGKIKQVGKTGTGVKYEKI